MSVLVRYAKQLRNQLERVRAADLDAANRAVSIGLILCRAKALLPKGEFGDWLKSLLGEGYSERHARRCMRLGEWVLKQKPEFEALLMASEAGDEHAQDVLDLQILEFVAGRTQTELFVAAGVLRHSPAGGAREAERRCSPEQRARETWNGICGTIHQCLRDRDYERLTRAEIEAAISYLQEAYKALLAYLREARKGG